MKRRIPRHRILVVLALLLLPFGGTLFSVVAPSEPPPPWPRVGIASSLNESVGPLLSDPGTHLVAASSGRIAAQLRAGAPLDVVVLADAELMDGLAEDGLVLPATRRVVAGNRLVAVAGPGVAGPENLAGLSDGSLRVALGEPETVPLGTYSAEALRNAGIPTPPAGRVVYGASASQVIAYVLSGDADAAIVYATDAWRHRDHLRVITEIDPALHRPVVYVAAITSRSELPDAGASVLRDFEHPVVRDILQTAGYTLPGAADGPAADF